MSVSLYLIYNIIDDVIEPRYLLEREIYSIFLVEIGAKNLYFRIFPCIIEQDISKANFVLGTFLIFPFFLKQSTRRTFLLLPLLQFLFLPSICRSISMRSSYDNSRFLESTKPSLSFDSTGTSSFPSLPNVSTSLYIRICTTIRSCTPDIN